MNNNNNSNTTSQSSGTVGASSDSLSLDDLSKLFNMPIADAANILGVCSSVLKKICRDNGIVRWPYRKFSGAQLQSKIPSSMNTTPARMMQQEGNRLFQSRWPNQNLHSNLKDLLASLDEFKDGFPSNGLSTSTPKWWGSSSSFIDGTNDEIFEEESTNNEVGKQQSQGSADLKKDFANEVKPVIGTEASKIGPQGTALLLSVREKAAEEGREALKTGAHRSAKRSFKLTRREKLLLKVFKSSLPHEWRFES